MGASQTGQSGKPRNGGRRKALLVGGAFDQWWGPAQALRDAGIDLEPVARETPGAEVGARAKRDRAVVVADLSVEPERVLEKVEACRSGAPGVPVIAVAPDISLDLARRLRAASVFYVAIHPVEPSEIEAALHNAFDRLGDETAASSCRAKKILIIDDDRDFRASTAALLEREGYAIVQAASGREGLMQVVRERPDLVLLDIMMENAFAGYEVNQALKHQDSFTAVKDIPVLMVSSVQTPPDDRFRQSPEMPMLCPDGYLTKPLDIAAFLARVRELLAAPPPAQT